MSLSTDSISISANGNTQPQFQFIVMNRRNTGSGYDLSRGQDKDAGGPHRIPSLPATHKKSGAQVKPTMSESSRELSDDDDLQGETEMSENMDPADSKRVRRCRVEVEASDCSGGILGTIFGDNAEKFLSCSVITLMENALEDAPKQLSGLIKTKSDSEVWAQVRSAHYEYRGTQKRRFILLLVNDPTEVSQLHELILKGKELGESSAIAASINDSSVGTSSIGDSPVGTSSIGDSSVSDSIVSESLVSQV